MKWIKLKDFCNSLNDEQLQKKVIVWREDEAISRINAELLPEDQYIGDGEEGCYPESEVSEPIETLKKVYSKGDPILWEKF